MVQKVFVIGKTALLGLYAQNHEAVYAEQPGASHVAHVTWTVPGARSLDNRSGIDYFLLDQIPPGADVHRWYEYRPTQEVEERHSVQYQLMERHSALEQAVRKIAAFDIDRHTLNKKEPAVSEAPRLSLVLGIDTKQGITPKKHASIEAQGKQDFYPECILDLNLDFARWCVSGITPDMKLAPWQSCIYCYAAYKHKAFPDVYSVDRSQLTEQIEEARAGRAVVGKPTRFLRLGKRVDCGPEMFRPQLMATLEACVDTGLSVVFPTKYLTFDADVAELLHRTDSTLLFSFGNDGFEPGVVAHGCGEDWRWETARRYLDSGVRVAPYVIVDAIREDGGPHFKDNLNRGLEFPNMQVIPVRIRYKDVARRILGSWSSVVGQHEDDLFGERIGGYDVGVDRTRLHNFVHPSIEKRVCGNDGRVRMCSHNLDTTWCGKCFVSCEKGMIGPTGTQDIVYDKKRPSHQRPKS